MTRSDASELFRGPLSKIFDRFSPGDVSWAKEVSQYTGDARLISQINEWEIQNVLSVEEPDLTIARRQFEIYLEREQYNECRDVLEHIPNDTEKRQKTLQIEWKEGGFVGVIEHLDENLSTDILEDVESFLEFIPELDKLLKKDPSKVLHLATQSNISKMFDDSKSTGSSAQRLIVISLLMEYMNILKDKDSARFQQFRIKLTDLVRRKNQTIIRGCAFIARPCSR